MSDGLNGPTNEEARELLEIRLEEAQAQHAEDLAKLGRELAGVVVQRDEARRAEREYDSLVDSVRTALCASMSECTDVAARRVAGERDLARAERDKYFQACENWRKLDAPLSEFRRVLRVGDYESTLDAARRMSRELEVCLGQLDHVMAREKSIQLEAYALGRKSAAEQEAERDSLAAELAAIRAATGEEPSDDGLFKVGVTARLSCSDVPNANLAERRALYNLGRDAARGEVARMREDVATLRARVAELEAAPVGLPVATDEELWEVGDQAWYACTGNSTESRHAGALAVAARVRAERPTCLVERAVALGVDVRVCEDVAGWLVAIHESSDLDEDVHRDVAASDVPATLSRLLDEVEAARKAVQR